MFIIKIYLINNNYITFCLIFKKEYNLIKKIKIQLILSW